MTSQDFVISALGALPSTLLSVPQEPLHLDLAFLFFVEYRLHTGIMDSMHAYLLVKHSHRHYERGKSATVVMSTITDIPVGRKVYSISGTPTHTMNNDQISAALNNTTALPLLVPSKEECLQANGFYVAKRWRPCCDFVVTDSSRSDVVNKAIVVSVGGMLCTNDTVLDDIIFALGVPGAHVETKTVEAHVRELCLQCSGLYIQRLKPKDKNSLLTVISATDPSEIGNIVWNCEGTDPLKLTQTEIHRMLQSPNPRSQFTLRRPPTPPVVHLPQPINQDAANYAEAYDSLTLMNICCVCGIEDSQANMIQRTECSDIIQQAKLSTFYHREIASLRCSTTYDQLFADAMEREFDEGLLRDVMHVCKQCFKEMKSKTSASFSVPKKALIRGLYPGPVPSELQDLNQVEQSMISIYSCVSRIALLGGTHYRTRGATTYTVVNDVTAIAKQLPRMPTIDSIATLQYKTGKSDRQFTFRPNRVRDALLWLKENNPLYESIPIELPQDPAFSWSDTEAQDIPHLLLTKEENDAVDEALSYNQNDTMLHQSTNTGGAVCESQILVMTLPDPTTHEATLRAAVGCDPTAPTVRRSNDLTFVNSYSEPDHFLSKLFPHLFPYARGCPSDRRTSFKKYGDHCKIMLTRGGTLQGRRFQQCPTYYFTLYTIEVKRKLGGIVYRAADHDDNRPTVDDNTDITVAEMTEILRHLSTTEPTDLCAPVADTPSTLSAKEMKKLIARLVPYAACLKGTPLHISHERKKLMAMIASPLIATTGTWRWFVTLSPSDSFEPRLYQLLSPGESWFDRELAAGSLSLDERNELLSHHPALSARLFELKQDCLWQHVIGGQDKPFGTVLQTWRRIEFQMRGTPHCHALICVAHDGIDASFMTSPESDKQTMVKELVDNTVTCCLCAASSATDPQRALEETDYEFQPEAKEYFSDPSDPDLMDPRLYSFNPHHDYTRCSDGTFVSPWVAQQYRHLQIANQIHQCKLTCFKYLKPGEPRLCRFGFPFPFGELTDSSTATFHSKRDNKGRMRMYVLPKRNNAHVNNTGFRPLLPIAHAGNHDIKYIDSPYGSAEYAASYVGKPESPDYKLMTKLVAKKIGSARCDRDRLRIVSTSLINSTHVGAVQACYTLLGLDFVNSSVAVINVNPLHRRHMSQSLVVDSTRLEELADSDSAVTSSVGSQLGRRNAYQSLCTQQRRKYNHQCYITFFVLLTYYSLNDAMAVTRRAPYPEPPLLHLHDDGSIVDPPTKFQIANLSFVLKKEPVVVNLTPFVPIDLMDERSCYCLLLMHTPWPIDGELSLAAPHANAIEAVAYLRTNQLLAAYVSPALERLAQTDNYLRTLPLPNDPQQQDDPEDDASDDGHDEHYDLPDHSHTHDTDFLLQQEALPDLSTNEGVLGQLPQRKYLKYKRFLSAALGKYMDEFSSENRLDFEDIHLATKFHDEEKFADAHKVPNHTSRLQALHEALPSLTKLQRHAYDRALLHLTGDEPSPLLMFLTGEGGTGKSRLIHLLTEYAHLHFGKQAGLFGAVAVAAPTGTSANNINGFTWQSILGIGLTKDSPAKMNDATAKRVGANLLGVKLFILDEISLVSSDYLYAISLRFQKALLTTTEHPHEREYISSTPFGGVHVLLAGDLWQLNCVQGSPLYVPKPPKPAAKAGQAIWTKLNEFVELTENCRFKEGQASPFAQFQSQARTATLDHPVSNHLLDLINQRLVLSASEAQRKAGPHALWIATTNERVNTINRERLQHASNAGIAALRIVARHTPAKSLLPFPTSDIKQKLFEIYDKEYMTHIDLAIGMPVMCTRNLATKIGVFNGAMGTVVGFLHHMDPPSPESRFPLVKDFHTLVNREIPIVLVDLPSYRGPPLFHDSPRVVPFTEECSRTTFLQRGYHRWMVPLRLAAAMTAHKSQSLTAHHGAVIEPSEGTPFARAIEYVQISRVPTMDLLFLTRPLLQQHFTSHNEQRLQILKEYERLRNLFPVQLYDNQSHS